MATSLAWGDPAKPKTAVEFRLAEDQPAEGLEEATVPDQVDKIYLHSATVLTRQDIVKAEVQTDDNQRYSILLTFSAKGAEKISQATEDNIGKRLAVVVDGKVITAPTIRTKIAASAIVTGRFKKTEAEQLAATMRSE